MAFQGVEVKYLSVCSGIEAATVAWHPLGWEAVAFSEIDAFPNAVLAHHYPSVPNLGDMEKFNDWPRSNFDVLVVVDSQAQQKGFRNYIGISTLPHRV